MGWNFRFRRSIKIAPGVRFNFNKRSKSSTMKTGRLSRTVNTNGTRTTNVHVGKGASLRKTTRR